ncbi:MAG: hypothetical protein LBQ60_01805 [Bacteroidales bacterium]|jgi:hypothetical protein|nr:hypothetical protein [Bacteroidales bacterium]
MGFNLTSGLFSTSKPRQFNYRPMYYDERKERLEKMKAEAENDKTYVGLQRGFLTERREQSKLRRASLDKISTMRFLMILVILIAILYFIMPELFQAMWAGK